MNPSTPVQVLVTGHDPSRIERTARRLEACGFRCATVTASPATLRGGPLRTADVIVAIEIGGAWQPTRRLIEAARSADRHGTAPVLVLAEEVTADERVEALASEEGRVWDWVEVGCADREIAARLNRLARAHRAAIQVARLELRCASLERTDRLTGLLSHSAFQEALKGEFRRAQRYGAPLSLILADLDRFRSLNEMHGHDRGDRLLQAAACALRPVVREVDLVARYGGDEFALLVPQASPEAALGVARRALERLGSLQEPDEPRRGPLLEATIRISASLGIATYPEEGIATCGTLISAADAALRRAKQEGRNRVVAYARGAPAGAPRPETEEAREDLHPGAAGAAS